MIISGNGPGRWAPGSQIRVVIAGLSAFLLPGFYLAALTFLLPNHGCIGGQRYPTGAWEWGLSILGASLGLAPFAAPNAIVSLLIWRVVHRRGLSRPWVFCLLGLGMGLTWPTLLMVNAPPADVPRFFLLFAGAGILTASSVWTIAYGTTRSQKGQS